MAGFSLLVSHPVGRESYELDEILTIMLVNDSIYSEPRGSSDIGYLPLTLYAIIIFKGSYTYNLLERALLEQRHASLSSALSRGL